MADLTKKYPLNVQSVIGGRSYEGRNINGVKLSFKSENKAVFIEGGIHAREWISPAVVTYILNEFLTSRNADVRNVAESYDWYFFPSINPDGFEYTHTTVCLDYLKILLQVPRIGNSYFAIIIH